MRSGCASLGRSVRCSASASSDVIAFGGARDRVVSFAHDTTRSWNAHAYAVALGRCRARSLSRSVAVALGRCRARSLSRAREAAGGFSRVVGSSANGDHATDEVFVEVAVLVEHRPAVRGRQREPRCWRAWAIPSGRRFVGDGLDHSAASAPALNNARACRLGAITSATRNPPSAVASVDCPGNTLSPTR